MIPLKTKALDLLARREHSRLELQQKLQQRGYLLSEINPMLDYLEQENLLSEARFIGSYIRLRKNAGFGPLKICTELQNRGINRSRIFLHEEWQNTLWEESAITLRIKRFGEMLPRNAEEGSQQTRFLQQRGFTFDQIRAALKTESFEIP